MVIEITERSDYQRVNFTVALGCRNDRLAFENEFGNEPHSTKNGMFKMMCRMADFVNNELKDECMFTVC